VSKKVKKVYSARRAVDPIESYAGGALDGISITNAYDALLRRIKQVVLSTHSMVRLSVDNFAGVLLIRSNAAQIRVAYSGAAYHVMGCQNHKNEPCYGLTLFPDPGQSG
jgi:hypothetical protein